jgi:hypothetical protein
MSHSFCGSGIQAQLPCVCLAQGLQEGYSQDVNQGCLRLKDVLSRWHAHVAGKLVLVTAGRSQLLAMLASA